MEPATAKIAYAHAMHIRTHTHEIRVEFKNWFDTNEPEYEYIINVNYRIPFVYLKGRHF